MKVERGQVNLTTREVQPLMKTKKNHEEAMNPILKPLSFDDLASLFWLYLEF